MLWSLVGVMFAAAGDGGGGAAGGAGAGAGGAGGEGGEGGEAEYKAKPYNEFMSGQIEARMGKNTYPEPGDDASDVEKQVMEMKKQTDELMIERDLLRDEKTVRAMLPDATDGQIQRIIDKGAGGDIGSQIDAIKTAVRTTAEKEDDAAGGKNLHTEGAGTTDNGAGDKQTAGVARRESASGVLGFFKKQK